MSENKKITAFKKMTQKGNLLIFVEHIKDKKFERIIFYASPDMKRYLVSEKHELKRNMPFDKSEWNRSKTWENQATELSKDELHQVKYLWSIRSVAILKKRKEIVAETKKLRKKNQEELLKLRIKSFTTNNNLGDFFKKSLDK